MINFVFYANPTRALACVPSGYRMFFSLAEAGQLTGVHPELLRYYCRIGVVETPGGRGVNELLFDEAALHEIRRVEHYRRQLGVGRRALPLLCELRREGERQHIPLRFLRRPPGA